MKKFVAGAAVAAALAAGSAALAVVNPLGSAGAGSISVQAGTQDTTATTAAPATPSTGDGGKGTDHKRPDVLGGVLDDLVKDGTISQDQADKIKAKLKEKFQSMGPGEGHGGPGGPGGGRGMMGAGLDTLAKELGMTADEIKAGFKDGKTIADMAKAKGIDPQKVIDDLVAEATKKIDEAVAAGKVDADRAAKAKEGMKDHITKFVNEGMKDFGGWGGSRGRGGPHGDKPSTTPTTKPA